MNRSIIILLLLASCDNQHEFSREERVTLSSPVPMPSPSPSPSPDDYTDVTIEEIEINIQVSQCGQNR